MRSGSLDIQGVKGSIDSFKGMLMTQVLRNVLLAGAAVAALSLGACAKKTDAAADSASASADAAAAASSATDAAAAASSAMDAAKSASSDASAAAMAPASK